jgi:hypothetical protein
LDVFWFASGLELNPNDLATRASYDFVKPTSNVGRLPGTKWPNDRGERKSVEPVGFLWKRKIELEASGIGEDVSNG